MISIFTITDIGVTLSTKDIVISIGIPQHISTYRYLNMAIAISPEPYYCNEVPFINIYQYRWLLSGERTLKLVDLLMYIKVYGINAKIDDEEIEAHKNAIILADINEEIVVNKDGVVICGHYTLGKLYLCRYRTITVRIATE